MTTPGNLRRGLVRSVPAIAAPAAIAAFTVAGAIQTHRTPVVVLSLCGVVVLTAVVLIRIDATGWRLVIGLAILASTVAVACWGEPRNFGWFGMCVVAGWAALVLPARWAAVVGAALALTFIAMFLLVSREPGWITWMLGVVLSCGAFIFVRRQRGLVERLHAAQSELSEHARTDERHRIAREMHDLVGHSLTVALLHLGSARLALDDDLAAARAALIEAENAARDSLDEVRAAVGLLRSGQSDSAPSPGIDGIADLVEAYRNAGADIAFDLDADPMPVAPSRGLAAYRIVQESLTNAVRHGDGGPIVVRVDAATHDTRITVRNGAIPGRRHRPHGTGITSMEERVAAVGGTLRVGPPGTSGGGWLVEAVIPA